MSSTPLDLPVLISQMHHVAKIAHAEKAGPEIRKQLFGPLIHEHIRKNESKVQQVEKKEATAPLDRDGHQQHKGQQQLAERENKEKEDKDETKPSNTSPWTGNIINVKI
ncbi:hypothetical protein GKC30_05375 [Pseudodesulfovibrio sp. F-1]|uniref:Uncharacterized protein n=1 Tax=Pseudodesulfovibrio alkaliphilus TaxID=2661613 RepID=A0A7K1KM22_9BACT|nr:hypothetical protein [Pseudodesulfovibrio alkaliphilus]MUM77057.1 hypothetical protein [Pseudodesulfovibrio alkaliphilus]